MNEIESQEQFGGWLAKGATPVAAVQGLDLVRETAAILGRDFSDCLFIGCGLEAESVLHIVSTGGLVVPRLPGLAFATHRPGLYTPAELFDGFDPRDPGGFFKTTDHRIYEEYCRHGKANPVSILVSLARRLHDHSITDALMETIDGRKVVAVMGGHGLERSAPDYARVARISRQLTRHGFLMVTGGGPGAMEAAHLGASFAAREEAEMAAGIEMLSPRPDGAEVGKEYADPDWLHRAWRVMDRFPVPADTEKDSLSIGIPTWFYGHEPPTPFAARIAKYFANSVREEGLLMIAKHGVVFAKGSAGTIQEIFQDAAQNHYGTSGWHSPMILLGVDFWTKERPVWPLLEKLSGEKRYAELITITDSEEEVVQRIHDYSPEAYQKRG